MPDKDKFWDNIWDCDRAIYQLTENEREKIEFIMKSIPNDVATICDVGSGIGKVSNRLVMSYDVVAIDRSLIGLKKVKVLKKAIGDLQYLPISDRSFDMVLCTEVLEHIGNHEEFRSVLKDLERVSKKYILITNPANDDPGYYIVRCNHCGATFHPSQHVRYFSKETYNSLFPQYRLLALKETGRRYIGVKALINLALFFSNWTGDAYEGMVCLVCGNPIRCISYRRNIISMAFKAINALIWRFKKLCRIYRAQNYVVLYERLDKD